MVCPGCGHENEEGSRKCAACSLPLPTKGVPPPATRHHNDPEQVKALGGEPPPRYHETPAVLADPQAGYLGKPRPDAVGDRSRFRTFPGGQRVAFGHVVAVGVRSGVAVSAFLGFLASLLAVGAYQSSAVDPASPLGIFIVCFLRYLAAGIVAGAVIGAFTAALGNLSLAWVVGVPLGILFWALFQLPVTLIGNEPPGPAIAEGIAWFSLAGGGFGHLVGRLMSSSLSRWD